jgi:hypothetical protein
MVNAVVACAIILMSVSSYGEMTLGPGHPDEPAGHTLDQRFSTTNSLQSLAAVQSALESFRKLTEAAADKIPKKRLAEIGNTGWDMQNLGFVNHVGTIKGTLLKQDFLMKKLAYELAQLRSKSGEVSQRDLLESKAEYEKAEKQFQQFWSTFRIAD